MTELPARIGFCKFSRLNGVVAVQCPRKFNPVMRDAGARWDRNSRRWLIEPGRIGPLIRTLHLIRNEEQKLLATWLNTMSAGAAVAGTFVPFINTPVTVFLENPLTPASAQRFLSIMAAWAVALILRWPVQIALRRLREPGPQPSVEAPVLATAATTAMTASEPVKPGAPAQPPDMTCR